MGRVKSQRWFYKSINVSIVSGATNEMTFLSEKSVWGCPPEFYPKSHQSFLAPVLQFHFCEIVCRSWPAPIYFSNFQSYYPHSCRPNLCLSWGLSVDWCYQGWISTTVSMVFCCTVNTNVVCDQPVVRNLENQWDRGFSWRGRLKSLPTSQNNT